MRKQLTRVNAVEGTFVRMEVELRDRKRDGQLELTVCGSAGSLESLKYLRDSHREMIADYVNDSREQSHLSRAEKRRMIAADMASFDPLDHDCIGEVKVGRKRLFMSVHSCGQIRDELEKAFTEHAKHFDWHLNFFDTSLVAAGKKGPLPVEVHSWFASLPDDGFEVIAGKAVRQ